MQLERFPQHHNRDLMLAAVSSLPAAEGPAASLGRDFILFLALDATSQDPTELEEFARHCLAVGACYVCAWGPGCSAVHVIFDFAYIDAEEQFSMRRGWTDADTVLTTWHEDESLESALWFAAMAAYPTDAFGADTFLAVVVANSDWAERVRAGLRDPEALFDGLEE